MALLGEWEQGVKLIKKAIIPLVSEGDIFYITVYQVIVMLVTFPCPVRYLTVKVKLIYYGNSKQFC